MDDKDLEPQILESAKIYLDKIHPANIKKALKAGEENIKNIVGLIQNLAESKKSLLVNALNAYDEEIKATEKLLTSFDTFIQHEDEKYKANQAETKEIRSRIIDLQEEQKNHDDDSKKIEKAEKEKEQAKKSYKYECDECRNKLNPKKAALIYKANSKAMGADRALINETTKLLLCKGSVDHQEIESIWSSYEILSGKMAQFNPEAATEELANTIEKELRTIVVDYDPIKNPKNKDKSEQFLICQWGISTCQLIVATISMKNIVDIKKKVIVSVGVVEQSEVLD